MPGVAEINTWGGLEKQFEARVDPVRLAKYKLTLDDVSRRSARTTRTSAAATIDTAGRGEPGSGRRPRTRCSTRSPIVTIAAHDGVPIRVRDVAEVAVGHVIRRGGVTANGKGEAVLGLAFMRMGENSREVTRALDEAIGDVRKALPPGVNIEVALRADRPRGPRAQDRRAEPARGGSAGRRRPVRLPRQPPSRSDRRVGNPAVDALRRDDDGASRDRRQPDEPRGHRLRPDRRQLGRHGRELRPPPGRTTGLARSKLAIIRDAAVEVRKPTMFGELIIMIVYLPILTLQGVEGKLFRPMALTVVFALAASMVLSLTLMPVLASLGLSRRTSEKETIVDRARPPPLPAAAPARACDFPSTTLVVVGAVTVAATILGLTLGSEFVPRLDEGTIVINTVRLAGVSLEESLDYGTRIERMLKEEFPDEVDEIWTRTGTAEVATDPMGLEMTDVFITLKPRERWKRARTQEELVAGDVGGDREAPRDAGCLRPADRAADQRDDRGHPGRPGDQDLRRRPRRLEATGRRGGRAVVEKIPGAADVGGRAGHRSARAAGGGRTGRRSRGTASRSHQVLEPSGRGRDRRRRDPRAGAAVPAGGPAAGVLSRRPESTRTDPDPDGHRAAAAADAAGPFRARSKGRRRSTASGAGGGSSSRRTSGAATSARSSRRPRSGSPARSSCPPATRSSGAASSRT